MIVIDEVIAPARLVLEMLPGRDVVGRFPRRNRSLPKTALGLRTKKSCILIIFRCDESRAVPAWRSCPRVPVNHMDMPSWHIVCVARLHDMC